MLRRHSPRPPKKASTARSKAQGRLSPRQLQKLDSPSTFHHLRNKGNSKENGATPPLDFHSLYARRSRPYRCEDSIPCDPLVHPKKGFMEKIVADLIKVYPTSFMKEMLPNSLLSHGGAISPEHGGCLGACSSCS